MAALFASGCGTAAVATTGDSADAAGTSYARTPTSSGLIDHTAVPLGDGYVSTKPRVGYVDSCITHFGAVGGSQVAGPWINTSKRTWDLRTKLAVSGSVHWPGATFKVRIHGTTRVISLDDLPVDHTTGVFPIAASDPAHTYDQNGNHIAAQSLTWNLPAHPRAVRNPGCTGGGPIGVLSDGVVLYNALDGQGRDAAAHEVLDACGGHPDPSDTYHHHDVPPCILNRVRAGTTRLVGYALDGYGIYVQKDRRGRLPGNRALDRCHGTTSRVMWNGKLTRIYHYVATLEYPYTIGCFHGTAISSGRGPGSGTAGSTGAGGAPAGAGGAPAGSGGTAGPGGASTGAGGAAGPPPPSGP